MRADLAARLGSLQELISPLRRVIVAYSGGVDSSLVLEVSHQALGDGCVGVIARSPSLAAAELDDALQVAAVRGITVDVIETREFDQPGYIQNGPDRCYFCKHELYTRLTSLARERGCTAVLDGFNRDDRRDWRPGRKAAAENSVRSPLDEVGMTKADVRETAAALGLPNWDKPAAACLSSRVPYGVPVTIESLERIEAAELALKAEGFRQVRVRDNRGAATIEVEFADLPRLLGDAGLRRRIERRLGAVGFTSVDVDRHGYRTGSLNQALLGS